MYRCILTALCLCGVCFATEHFDKLPSGEFTELGTKCGRLAADKGHAEIHDKHSRSGKKSLRILGGENRQVTLTLDEPLAADENCDFYMERWTGRAPFEFTIEADGKEVFRNTTLRQGAFHGPFQAPLPAGTKTVTFKCTSASGGGVMLDDLAILSTPMTIDGVEVQDPGAYPLLKGARLNPAVRVQYTMHGDMDPVTPGTITFHVTPGALERVTLRSANADATDFRDSAVYGTATPDAEGNVTITCTEAFKDDVGTLWIDATPAAGAKVGSTVEFSGFSIEVAGKTFTCSTQPVSQRVGYMLAEAGVPVGQLGGAKDRPCVAFRIPGLITTKNGTVIGVFDARYHHGGDLCADIDVAAVRSTDGGQTWTKPTVILDGGPGEANGCGDPAIVQDANGRIWVQALTCHFKGGASLWTSKTGNDYNTTGQWEMTYSDDDGVTWATEHVNPTKSIKKDEWHCILAGPGCAITLKDGTIVFPAQIWQHDAKYNCMSTICYSKDGGKTWAYGEGVPHRTSECQVVQLPDGSLMLNCRNENRSGKRVIYVSKDLGKTWTPHETNLQALQEPTCQASLIAIGDGRQLLFSNPKSGRRDHMTIRYSADAGKTWSDGVEYDTRGCAGYSCLTMVDDHTVGVIYEAHFIGEKGGDLSIGFLLIPLEEITGK